MLKDYGAYGRLLRLFSSGIMYSILSLMQCLSPIIDDFNVQTNKEFSQSP